MVNTNNGNQTPTIIHSNLCKYYWFSKSTEQDMRLEELYAKYDAIVGAGGFNVTPIQHFVFDLTDENSQNSLKAAFPGIESLLMPESGKYLVASTIVEQPDILVLMFPSQSDGSLGLSVFNTATKKGKRLDNARQEDEEQKTTIDNFTEDFANMEDIARKFNEFAFMDNTGEVSTEVKDIGSFDISTDEPVETTNPNTDNEETEMNKPINEEDELKETKWVEIPNTNAHGVTVTEDGEEQADPFADGSLDATADAGGEAAPAGDATAGDAAPAEGDAATTDAGQEQAPAEGDAAAGDAPAADATAGDAAQAGDATSDAPETIDDPKAKMRDLLAYYTNYMTELVKDPNTSTELISATQEMIDSLIKNMESADGIEEVKADQEEAAKEEVSAEETPAEGEGEAAPAEGDAATTEEPVTEGAGCAAIGGAAGAALGGPIGAAAGAALGSAVEETSEKPVTEDAGGAAEGGAVEESEDEEKADDADATSDAAVDAEIDDLHKDDIEPIEPIAGDDILTPGDIRNSAVNDVDLGDVAPTSDEELAATTPDETAPAPTSDVLDDTELPSPDEEVSLLGTDDLDEYAIGADGLPVDKFDGDIDALTTSPVAKKINWSSDYAVNGIATTDDNSVVVPEVLKELEDYYKKVADEVSKVPGKEDVAMKLQKIQILSQTIANEWNGIVGQISDTCANSYDLSNMCDLEKDELASQDAMNMIGADVMADQEQDEEDDLAINADIAAFVESFKHLY